jgi:hypothetical protein
MAKQVQVVVTVICDWCKKKWREDDEEAPIEREWSWNGTSYVVEVCGDCLTKVREHLQPLFEASEQKARKAGRPKLTPEQRAAKARRVLPPGSFDKYKNEEGIYRCPSPGCPREFNYPQHLGNHYHKIHGSFLD